MNQVDAMVARFGIYIGQLETALKEADAAYKRVQAENEKLKEALAKQYEAAQDASK